jgi:hypothetical protein
MIRRETLQPAQWQILRRLQAVGCPLDCERLPEPIHPLRVRCGTLAFGTNLVSLPGGMGVILPLQIIASVPITINRFELKAEWLRKPVTWVSQCRQHGGNLKWYYCLHRTSHGDLRFTWETTLNHRTGNASQQKRLSPWIQDGVLKRGAEMKGPLVGTFEGALPVDIGPKLEATLSIEDLFGKEYPYYIALENKRPAGEPSLR